MDLIAQVRAELTQISARKEGLLGEVARLDTRLTELETVLRVAEGYSKEQTTETESDQPRGNGQTPTDELTKRGAQKRLIEEALQASMPQGLTKAGVTQWIADRYGVNVAPNYVGVALDRLKGKNLVRLEGTRWVPQFGASSQ